MIARGYVQIVPKRNRRNEVTELRLANLTKTYPRSPEAGALVLQVSFEVDAGVFATPRVTIDVVGEPDALSAAMVPIPVPDHEYPPVEADDDEVADA